MNKTIIVGGASLVLGLAGGTGWSMTRPEPEPSEELTSADASSTDPSHAGDDVAAESHDTPADHSTDGAATADDAHSADTGMAESGAASAGAGHESTQPSLPVADATPPSVTTGTDTTKDQDPTVRLGNLLGAMRPEEAARILEPLEDAQVKLILFGLPERKAAAILAKFKGERAAALAKAIIAHGGEN